MKYFCSNCNKYWNHQVNRCIFCGHNLDPVQETEYKVVGYTEVFVPSTNNEKVPYYVNLMEDRTGQRIVHKSFQKFEIGDAVDLSSDITSDHCIGVIGSGLLGTQIAAFMIQNGYKTVLKTRFDEGMAVIADKIRKMISKRMGEAEVDKAVKSLIISTDYQDIRDCDIIIEAVSEDIDIKTRIFREISDNCSDTAIIASNSSSLSIDLLASVVKHPENCIGMHFFNPVHRMDLVEVVMGDATSSGTRESVVEFVLSLRKKPIVVRNSPGYVVNRLLLPQINEAALLLEEGVASKEDIDNAIKLGLNHPMGPFELADLIGLDVCLSIIEVLYEQFGTEKYKPANILSSLVKSGKLGIKTGEGFYVYGKRGN